MTKEHIHKLITIDTKGNIVDTQTKKKPTLEELQSIVDGYIEVIHGMIYKLDGKEYICQMIVDEEGRIKHKDFNDKATEIYRNSICSATTLIVGNVAILIGWRF